MVKNHTAMTVVTWVGEWMSPFLWCLIALRRNRRKESEWRRTLLGLFYLQTLLSRLNGLERRRRRWWRPQCCIQWKPLMHLSGFPCRAILLLHSMQLWRALYSTARIDVASNPPLPPHITHKSHERIFQSPAYSSRIPMQPQWHDSKQVPFIHPIVSPPAFL